MSTMARSLLAIFLLASSLSFAVSVRFGSFDLLQDHLDKVRASKQTDGVQLIVNNDNVTLDNGIISLTLAKPDGSVMEIKGFSIDNFLITEQNYTRRGYWDINWLKEGDPETMRSTRFSGTQFRVITKTSEMVEVSFSKTWQASFDGNDIFPANMDVRYIVMAGKSGFYAYAIVERPAGFPAATLGQNRIVFRPDENKFQYMAISDTKRRLMPNAQDRSPTRSQTLMFPEAVILTNPTNPLFRGEVDDKYQYSMDNQNSTVYGWMQLKPLVGFWAIYPSKEFQNGGPSKQDLTLHAGPTFLGMFHSTHYAGENAVCNFTNGETWTKVFGPLFFYINHDPTSNDAVTLWEDAKRQRDLEAQSWPYAFPAAPQYVKKAQRCTVSGRLLLKDKTISANSVPANGATIILASPGNASSWQEESKGYQFWTKADKQGNFEIANIVPSQYNVYGWVPGVIGDYMHNNTLRLLPGSNVHLGDLVYDAPRSGTTLWEIGVADRSAQEFFIPPPLPQFVNTLFTHQERYRQYGLWDRYTDMYPTNDLVYNVGSSNYARDWYFAHVPRRTSLGNYVSTTWQINFPLNNVKVNGAYTLRIAVATSSYSHIHVYVNDMKRQPISRLSLKGKDNSIPRHAIHGTYELISVSIPGSMLFNGKNSIYLSLGSSKGPFQGHMYDYIRLEDAPELIPTPLDSFPE